MPSDLFPMPLTPFELYYWYDDCAEYPTTFPLELDFRGVLQQEVFRNALEKAISRHPMLRAHVDTNVANRPRWVAATAAPPDLNWEDSSTPIEYGKNKYIDLMTSTGLRSWVRTSAERSRLILLFHHACCDALGAVIFIEDLLLAYSALCRGEDPEGCLRPLDPARLSMRGDYGLSEANYTPTLADALRTLRFWLHKLLQRPTLVASSNGNESSPISSRADLGYLTIVLTKHQIASIRRKAQICEATVNDLLLRDMLLTLEEWNHSCGKDSRQLVLNVPVSLRVRNDQRMPATNVLGYWFLTRGIDRSTDDKQLLQGIREEMEAVKKYRLPLYFVGGLGYGSRFPRIMRRVLRAKRSFATMVFSNTGRVLARTALPHESKRLICGDVTLENITGVPPIRRGTRVAVAVGTYANNTYVNLHWDPQSMSESQAQSLLDSFIRRVDGMVEDEQIA